MLCLVCLQNHDQDQMGSTFLCKGCVDSSQQRLDGNLTGRIMMKALRNIGHQFIVVETKDTKVKT
jgi:hypothetical protein